MYIRKLGSADWQIYKSLRLEALHLHADVFGTRYEDMESRPDSEWEIMLGREDQAFFGLFDGNVMVGSGGVYMQDSSSKTGMLISDYIRENYRGQGLSQLIYKARIEWAKESGLFNRLLIGHREGNEASRRANQAFGFKPIGEVECVFGDGEKAKNFEYELRIKTL